LARRIRKTNYEIGCNSLRERDPQSVYQAYFQGGQNETPEAPDPQKKKDLRSHHYKLGFSKDGPQSSKSENHVAFCDQEFRNDMKDRLASMESKTSNVENIFKTDQNKYYGSMYSEDFRDHQGKKDGFTKADLQKRLLALRCSNILMGTNALHCGNGTTQQDYAKIEDTRKGRLNIKNLNKIDNVFMGTANPSYRTIAHDDFVR
jgi:hypothetical protein